MSDQIHRRQLAPLVGALAETLRELSRLIHENSTTTTEPAASGSATFTSSVSGSVPSNSVQTTNTRLAAEAEEPVLGAEGGVPNDQNNQTTGVGSTATHPTDRQVRLTPTFDRLKGLALGSTEVVSVSTESMTVAQQRLVEIADGGSNTILTKSPAARGLVFSVGENRSPERSEFSGLAHPQASSSHLIPTPVLDQQSVASDLSFPTTVSQNQSLQVQMDLDRRLHKVLDLPAGNVLQSLRHDLTSHLTVCRAVELAKFALMTLEAESVGLPQVKTCHAQFVSFGQELSLCCAGQGPSDSAWLKLSMLFRSVGHELNVRRLHMENDHLRSQGPASVSMSHSSSGSSCTSKIDKIILHDLPIYDGTNFDRWLDHFEDVVVHQTQADLLTLKKLLAVKLGPKYSSISRTIHDLPTWDAVRQALIANFSATPGSLEMELQWNKLDQGDKSLRDYNADVLHMLHRSTGSHALSFDTSKISRYIQGLHEHAIRRRLFSMLRQAESDNRPRSLQDFLREAKNMDLNDQLARKDTGPLEAAANAATSSGSGSKSSSEVLAATPVAILGPNEKCYRHPYGQHNNSLCKLDKDACPYCHLRVGQAALQKGHVSNDCKAPKCDSCQRRGHTSDQCYNLHPERRAHSRGGNSGSSRGAAPNRRRSASDQGRAERPRKKYVRVIECTDSESESEAAPAVNAAKAAKAEPAVKKD